MSLLFESIKVLNGEVQNLVYHQNRVDYAFSNYFKKSLQGICLKDVIRFMELPQYGCYKLRISYNENSVQDVVINSYKPKKVESLKLVECNYIDYPFKYENREIFKKLLQKKGSADDILIVKNGEITDSSFSNIILYNGTEWITPTNPLLRGTCRERLLKNGIIKESTVYIKDLSKFQKLALINAMLEFNVDNAIEIGRIY